MDPISYSLAAKQGIRIEKFIENPDSTSGVLTQPSVIATGETTTIPAGRTAIMANTQIDGTLVIDGDVFIPSGATFGGLVEKVASTDNAIVRFNGTTGDVQNSGVVINDAGNLLLTSGIGALGYGTGAGGTVTQLTSRTTGVTLNKPVGAITLFGATTTAGQLTSCMVTNSIVTANDIVIPIHSSNGNIGQYMFTTTSANGYFLLHCYTASAQSPIVTPIVKFVVIKGATA